VAQPSRQGGGVPVRRDKRPRHAVTAKGLRPEARGLRKERRRGPFSSSPKCHAPRLFSFHHAKRHFDNRNRRNPVAKNRILEDTFPESVFLSCFCAHQCTSPPRKISLSPRERPRVRAERLCDSVRKVPRVSKSGPLGRGAASSSWKRIENGESTELRSRTCGTENCDALLSTFSAQLSIREANRMRAERLLRLACESHDAPTGEGQPLAVLAGVARPRDPGMAPPQNNSSNSECFCRN